MQSSARSSYNLVDEPKILVANGHNATDDTLRRRASNCHCYAYAAWRGKPESFNPQRYGIVWVASGLTASLLLALGKWINADVRTPQYFLQLACVLLEGLLLGVGMGSFFTCVALAQDNTTRRP